VGGGGGGEVNYSTGCGVITLPSPRFRFARKDNDFRDFFYKYISNADSNI